MGDVYIVKNQGLGKTTVVDDSVSGMLFSISLGIEGGLQGQEIYRLKSLDDLIKLGVSNSNIPVLYRNVQQFFRIAPNAELYIYGIIYSGTTVGGLCDKADAFLTQCEGKIKQLAVFPADRASTGFSQIIDNEVNAAQALAGRMAKQYMYTHIVIPNHEPYERGKLQDLRKYNAPDVSVALGVDATYANEVTELYDTVVFKNSKAVDLGIALGAIAKTGVHQSIAHVGTMNLYGQGLTVPAVCGGKLVSELSQGEQAEIEDKGYLSFKSYAGRAGIYFNDAATCTALTDDYAYIYTSRTMNKVMRTVRESLLPRINGNIRIDAVTGLIDPLELTELKEEASKGLARMQAFGEISGYDVEIDPEQDVIGTGMLYVTIYVVPVGVAKAIKVNVGYKSKLS
jgi:hypothetical protein